LTVDRACLPGPFFAQRTIMRAVVQRVLQAKVSVDDEVVAAIRAGLLVLLGVSREDREEDACWLADKTAHLRIFEHPDGGANRSVLERGGELLVVSQFTLYGDCRKGRRPSWSRAAPPEQAKPLYHQYVDRLRSLAIPVQTGVFGGDMLVSLVNDGPVTLLLDSEKSF